MPKAKVARPSSLPISGKVTARSPYGIKIEGIEDWLNFSKPEYRKDPWEADDVQKDDWVQMDVSGTFIKSIVLVEPPADEPMVVESEEDNPFEGMETQPKRSAVALDREASIQRAVALKAAVELVVGMAGGQIEWGPTIVGRVLETYRKFNEALGDDGG